MKWQVTFNPAKYDYPINLKDNLFLIGSCFTEHMAAQFLQNKFTIIENPHGILFNPISIVNALQDYIDVKEYTYKDLFEFNEIWQSWNHHSTYSNSEADKALFEINQSIKIANQHILKTKYLIITFGSSWAYQLKETGQIVANNHKVPNNCFNKILIEHPEIEIKLANVLNKLLQINPSLHFIFTISPVRHAREGLVENNISKANLIIAVQNLINRFENSYYFPAFEMVIDELRDYRFYAEDLVHPNYQATQYVWQKMRDCLVDNETNLFIDMMHEINIAYQHKPFFPNTNLHKAFLKKYAAKVKNLKENYPAINVEKEFNYFNLHHN